MKRRLGILLVFAGVAVVWWFLWRGTDARPIKDVGRSIEEGRRVTALVLAPDNQEALEAAILMSYEPLSGRMILYHVPLSTSLEGDVEDSRPGRSLPVTLETAYAKETYEELNRRLHAFLGADLTFTAVAPMGRIVRLVDLMGGIFVNVPTRISFRSTPAGTFDRFADWVEIPEGEEVFFDSDKTRMYLAYKFDGLGLRGQLFRGRKLAVAFLQRMKPHLEYEWFREELIAAFAQASSASVIRLFTALSDVPVASIDVRSLPGQADLNTGVFWMSRRELTSTLPRELKPLVEATAPKKHITVQLLNGTGKSNVAARFREQLSAASDIDIVEMGNAARRDYEITQIIDRAGHLPSAERVREVLGSGVLQQDINPKAMVDVTVILGQDVP